MLQGPAVGVETFLQSSGERSLRGQRVVHRHNGDVQLLGPHAQIILVQKEGRNDGEQERKKDASDYQT